MTAKPLTREITKIEWEEMIEACAMAAWNLHCTEGCEWDKKPADTKAFYMRCAEAGLKKALYDIDTPKYKEPADSR